MRATGEELATWSFAGDATLDELSDRCDTVFDVESPDLAQELSNKLLAEPYGSGIVWHRDSVWNMGISDIEAHTVIR